MHPFVYGLFFLTGAAGLIYQVVWLRVLIRLFGSTVQATSILVASFMAGLALGAWLFGKLIDARRAPLRWYALLELAVAATAVLLPLAFLLCVPILRAVFAASGEGPALLAARAAIAFALLLVPTCFMGGTFPILTVLATRSDGRLARNVGALYATNTLGAVTGSLLTGLVLIGAIGENATMGIAVALNVGVALIALALHGRLASQEAAAAEHPAPPPVPLEIPEGTRRIVLAVFAASGATALAYEVIWTRQLLFFLGTSVYAFSVMLALYLTGIAVGSAVVTRWIERSDDPVGMFGVLEIALGLVSIATLFLLVPTNWVYGAGFGVAKYAGAALAAMALVLPPTLLLGAIFPCAARAYAAGRPDTGAAVGRAYALNTAGGIIGSLAAGFALIPLVGTTRAIVLLGAVNVIGGGILLARSPRLRRRAVPAFAAAAAVLALLAAPLLQSDLFYRVVSDRILDRYPRLHRIRWQREDPGATVTVFSTMPGSGREKMHLWVNGVGMTTLVTVTKLMAHLPIVLGPEPAAGSQRRVLVICFGMGTTVRSAARWPDTRVEAIELLPGVIAAFPEFHKDARAVLSDPNVRVRAGDGRNWLLLSGEKYEVITVDPAPPIWSAGTVNLYSREFMQLTKDALTEDGVAQFWVSSAVTRDEFRMLIATFRSVFPQGTIWSGKKVTGYFLIGAKNGALRIDPETFRRRWTQPAIRADLTEWDDVFVTPESAMDLYVAGEERMAALAGGAPLITDNHPWVEFPLFRYLSHGKKRYPKKRLLAEREPIPLVRATR